MTFEVVPSPPASAPVGLWLFAALHHKGRCPMLVLLPRWGERRNSDTRIQGLLAPYVDAVASMSLHALLHNRIALLAPSNRAWIGELDVIVFALKGIGTNVELPKTIPL